MKSKFDNYISFYEVARNSSFSKAAEILFISQSAVSQSVAKLEKDLNINLIERTTKKMKLTEAGKVLYKQVFNSLESIKRAEDDIEDIINLRVGSLKIAVNDTICKYYLMPKLSKFIDKNQNINLKIINRPSNSSLNMLENEIVDIAVVNKVPEKSYDDYTEVKSFEYRDILIGNSLLDCENVTIKDLSTQKLIVLEKGTTTRNLIDAEFLKKRINFSPKLELTSIDLVFEFVEKGYGFGIVPTYASNFHKNIKEIKGVLNLPKRTASVMIKKNIPISIASRNFIEFIK